MAVLVDGEEVMGVSASGSRIELVIADDIWTLRCLRVEEHGGAIGRGFPRSHVEFEKWLSLFL